MVVRFKVNCNSQIGAGLKESNAQRMKEGETKKNKQCEILMLTYYYTSYIRTLSVIDATKYPVASPKAIQWKWVKTTCTSSSSYWFSIALNVDIIPQSKRDFVYFWNPPGLLLNICFFSACRYPLRQHPASLVSFLLEAAKAATKS